MRPVVHSHDETPRLTGAKRRCQLEGEGRVAALMLTELLAVEPRGRAPIGRAEHEEDAAAAAQPCVGDRDRARVPADVGAVGNSGERRAPGEGDEDFMSDRKTRGRPLCAHALVARIERKLPMAVEVQPVGALEVWARMLRERHALARTLGGELAAEQREARELSRERREGYSTHFEFSKHRTDHDGH